MAGIPAQATQRALRILLWSYKGAGLHYGGPGTSAYRLYSKAPAGRFDLTLAHGYAPQEPYPLFSAQHLIRPLNDQRPWSQWSYLNAALQWLRRHAREFDVFHGLQGFHLTVRPALEAQRLGLPAVVKLAAHQSDLADKPGWRSLLGLPARRRAMIAQIGGIIAISDAIARELLDYGIPESRIARIPNGVDTDQFHPAAPQERTDLRRQLGWRDLPTLLFVGAVTPRKNPLVLVEALALLHRQGVESQLVIAGPDTAPAYAAAIKARADELNLAGHVVWSGFTRDVAPLYRASDVYALPSSGEGMPNAALEALASGLPSILTPVSGSADLVRDGVNGRIAPADGNAIADALRQYFRDPALALQHGRAARQTIMSRYSAAAVLDAHERLFRRLISGGAAAE